jgi:hypothetical protein
MYVYVIRNSVTGKVYIGQHKGNNLKKYLQTKLSQAHYELKRKGKGRGSHLFASMRKQPKEVWSIEPLIEGIETRLELDRMECLYIAMFDTRNPEVGYNICRGGEGFTGKHTSEAKAKVSEKAKAWHSDPTKEVERKVRLQRISASLKARSREPVSKVCPVCDVTFSLPYGRRRVVFCSRGCFRKSPQGEAMEQKRRTASRAKKSAKIRSNMVQGQRIRRDTERSKGLISTLTPEERHERRALRAALSGAMPDFHRAAISKGLKGLVCDENRKSVLDAGRHKRWHVDRGVIKPGCLLCTQPSV